MRCTRIKQNYYRYLIHKESTKNGIRSIHGFLSKDVVESAMTCIHPSRRCGGRIHSQRNQGTDFFGLGQFIERCPCRPQFQQREDLAWTDPEWGTNLGDICGRYENGCDCFGQAQMTTARTVVVARTAAAELWWGPKKLLLWRPKRLLLSLRGWGLATLLRKELWALHFKDSSRARSLDSQRTTLSTMWLKS